MEFAGLSPVGAWWDRRGENEVDLIALDKSGKRIIFVEVKTRASKLDEAKLRQKAKAFFDAHGGYSSWEAIFLGLTPDQMLDASERILEQKIL